jgi:hypothetical protein
MNREELEKAYGKVWTTTELQQDFIVEGFSMGICVVKTKKEGVWGSLDFQHSPRFYHSFEVHEK